MTFYCEHEVARHKIVCALFCCSDLLNLYSCDRLLKTVYPEDMEQRKLLFDVYSYAGISLPPTYEMYQYPAVKLSALPMPCQLYATMGCSFVMNIAIVEGSKAQWFKFLNLTTDKIKNDYIAPINDTVTYVAYYTGIRHPTF
jgi:hypothetical protein